MIQYQRHQEIVAKLESNQAMSIRRLARELFTSESTIRRDLSELERQGLVKRVYGGVVLAKHASSLVPVFQRAQDNIAVKQIIAARAASLVRNGMSLFLDTSTTAACIVPHLKNFKHLTVITNSHIIAEKLGEFSSDCVHILCTGGMYLPIDKAFGGSFAVHMLEMVSVDLMFFSSTGINALGEISDLSEPQTEVRRAIMRRSTQRVFLCDQSKFGKQSIYRLCDRSGYDYIIIDSELPEELRDAELS